MYLGGRGVPADHAKAAEAWEAVLTIDSAHQGALGALIRHYRALDRFEERASLRVWLYRIATNRCLNALRDRRRRPKEYQAMVEPPERTRLSEPLWLEPYPDVLLEGIGDISLGPEARYEAGEVLTVAALQHLPSPALRTVLRDVLGLTRDVVDYPDSTEDR
jgi:RNA polymerase sigma-70 factor (ECF subfamily)